MKPSLPDVKAKVAPLVEGAKKEAMLFLYVACYCFVWLVWLAFVPFVWAGIVMQELEKKVKPKLPAKPEL